MQNPIIFLAYGSTIVYLLSALLLFSTRKYGDRSRMILASVQLFSGLAFALHFILLYIENYQTQSISVSTLIMSFIGVIIYLMYFIEVVSPRWLNLRRIAILNIPTFIIIGIYLISLWAGVKYIQYNSIIEMIPNITHFEVWFRLFLCLLIFAPVFYIFYVPYTQKYNNTNRLWMRTYVILITLNIFSYTLGIIFYDPILDPIFYYISSIARLIIVYFELFVRLNGRYISKNTATVPVIDRQQIQESIESHTPSTMSTSKTTILFERLDEYMHKNHAWRDPDLSMTYIVDILKTNRTTLAQAIQEQGHESYIIYINKLRIEDFIKMIKSGVGIPFQKTFYDVGFRSRNTALRNFRRVTGMIPSEYFHTTDENQ